MKTVGIIGGLGPQTTSEFYLKLGELCNEAQASSRPRILIESVPLPLDVEKDAIVNGTGEERCLPYLIDAAKSLELAGADFLVMPCNSLHVFIEEIRRSVGVPVLSIVEETIAFLKRNRIEKVGVISTAITLKNELYEKALTENSIACARPDEYQQAKLGLTIHNLVNGRQSNGDRKLLIETIDSMADAKVQHIILACTDLQLLIPSHTSIVIHDTMQILVEATAQIMIRQGYTTNMDMEEYERSLVEGGIEFKTIAHPKFIDPAKAIEHLGITEADTLPTLIMKAGDEFVVVLRRGDKRLDFKKLRQGINKRIRMATQEEFEALTGLRVGTARAYCPTLATYIDPSVLEKEYLFGGSGSFEHTIRYSTASIAKMPGSKILDMCD